MDQFKYKFTSIQVVNRWKTLEIAFKKKTEVSKQTGKNIVKCRFEK